MTDEKDDDPDRDEKAAAADEERMRALLKSALAGPSDKDVAPARPILGEVQRKIRQRSKGKFYGDGWSTAQSRVSYALVAGIMLLIVAIAYFVLGPMAITSH